MVSNISQIIAFTFEISLGIFGQKSINEKIIVISNDSRGLNSPLSPTTWEKILDTYSGENWRNIAWINRGVIDTSYLQHHPFVVIHGQMKSGKTREAAELIRCAIEDGIVPPSQVFDLTGALRLYTPEEISSRLSKELRCEMRTLFFLNEIPADANKKHLQALDVYLQALRTCSPGYFVTTVRSEHLNHNPLLQKWLEQNQVTQVSLTSLTSEETNILINKLHETCAFPWNENYRQEFVENCNGTPYHLILTFQRLNRLGGQINREEISRIASQSLKDIWADIRREMEKAEPVAASLFQALAVCHHADVTPLTPLVFTLAAWMEHQKRFLKIPWKVPERLHHVARSLRDYGISYEDQYNFPDVAVESLLKSAEEGCAVLDRYLKAGSREMNPSIRLQALSELGVSYIYQNNTEKAILVNRIIINDDKQNVIAWSNLGVLLNEQDRFEEAEEAYGKALAANPHYAHAWYNLGNLLKEQGRVIEAEETFRKALATDPQHAHAWYNLGNLLGEQGRVIEAEEAYRKAMTSDPKDSSTWYNLGNLLGEQGRVIEAEEAYCKTLAANPQYANAWSNLGGLLINQGRIEEAEEAFRKALAANPQLSEPWSNLGLLYRNLKKFTDAQVALQEAVRCKPESASYHSSLGAVYQKLGMSAEAEREFQLAQQLSEGDSLYNRACIAALAGDEDRAFSLLEEALDNQEVTRDWLRWDPDWDELRQDPRYLALVENEPASET